MAYRDDRNEASSTATASPDVIPPTLLTHTSQLNAFVKPKVFQVSDQGIKVCTADGLQLQSIPYSTITKLWEYDGLAAKSSDGHSFQTRYIRIYSTKNRPVYVSNTANLGTPVQPFVPTAKDQSERFDQLLLEIKRRVATANPKVRVYTGWLTVVLGWGVNVLIGAAMLVFPVAEFFMGTRQTFGQWMEFVGILAFFWFSGAMLIWMGAAFIVSYWPSSKPITSEFTN
jgi:hypothetical protein